MNKVFILTLCLLGITGAAQADRWDFLPPTPLFNPLIGDLREPQDAIIAPLNEGVYDGAIGQTVEVIQWQSNATTKWAWGIEGACFLELGSLGNAIFPLYVSDWYLGTYFSERSGNFSNRLEFEHVSSHLGDYLFDQYQYDSQSGNWVLLDPRIIYSRESLRYTASYDFSENFRLYGGPCYWTHLSPDSGDSRFFFHAGAEFYTDYFHFILGTRGRGYFTYDLKVLGEAGGVVDQTFEIGFQWRWKRDSHQSVRMAALYYTGNSPYGQFFQLPENYLGLGIFFDP
jgi:hypothetical protein